MMLMMMRWGGCQDWLHSEIFGPWRQKDDGRCGQITVRCREKEETEANPAGFQSNDAARKDRGGMWCAGRERETGKSPSIRRLGHGVWCFPPKY
jgi:hypothetical protein